MFFVVAVFLSVVFAGAWWADAEVAKVHKAQEAKKTKWAVSAKMVKSAFVLAA